MKCFSVGFIERVKSFHRVTTEGRIDQENTFNTNTLLIKINCAQVELSRVVECHLFVLMGLVSL